MLEVAGLEIDELIYRPDLATNYVLEEYCGEKPVTQTSRLEAEIGSGVTLYVGVRDGTASRSSRRSWAYRSRRRKGVSGSWDSTSDASTSTKE